MVLIIIVDHVRGTRRRQRQVFAAPERISFGRHEDNDVAFDGTRDIDASTRHAELRCDAAAGTATLRDLGSSNGTWIDGHRVIEREILLGAMVFVEFGQGGPLVRLWNGASESEAPAPPQLPGWWRRFLPW